MTVKYIDTNINFEEWNVLSDKDKVQKIKAASELVTYNMFTKHDIVFLLKEAVRLAEIGVFGQ